MTKEIRYQEGQTNIKNCLILFLLLLPLLGRLILLLVALLPLLPCHALLSGKQGTKVVTAL